MAKGVALLLVLVPGLWTVGRVYVGEGAAASRMAGLVEVEPPRQLSPKSPATLEELDRVLSDIAAARQLPGFGAAVVSADRVLFRRAYGFADLDKQIRYTPQSLHYIGSISKTLIGVSLMQLVERGRIRLDDDINLYLPFKITNPHFPRDVITIRHLATHTSTIRDRLDYSPSSALLALAAAG